MLCHLLTGRAYQWRHRFLFSCQDKWELPWQPSRLGVQAARQHANGCGHAPLHRPCRWRWAE